MQSINQAYPLNASLRMQAVQTPIIPSVAALIHDNPGTVSLGQGVVSYAPPQQAFERVRTFLDAGDNHKYGPVHGIADLQDAINAKLQTQNSIYTDDSQRVFVTAGSNMAFNSVVLAISEPGDEFILLLPYYFNHEMAITMAACRAVLVDTDENFQPVLEDIKRAITPRTRAVVTVSPNNPSGAVYSETTLREINQLCKQHQIFHISDEAYEDFVYEGVAHFSPASIEASHKHTISLFSLSKGFGFASWRVGYMVIPEHLNAAVNKVQDTILICPPSISQYAAVGALQAGNTFIRPKIDAIAQVRHRVLDRLGEISDIARIPKSDGAFYVLLRLQGRCQHAQDDVALVRRLIESHGVAVIPGSAFGITDGCYLRVAYGALDEDTAELGIERLINGLRAEV